MTIFLYCVCFQTFLTQAQGTDGPKDTIVKANGERIVCVINTFENDKIQYVTGGRFLTTTYVQRLSRISFSDGSVQEIQPILKISGEQDWQKVKVVSDPARVKNLLQVGIIDVQRQGSLFAKQEKVMEGVIDQIKKEAAKIGSHIVLLVESDNRSGGLELDGDRIIGIRPGVKFVAVAYGF